MFLCHSKNEKNSKQKWIKWLANLLAISLNNFFLINKDIIL